MNSYDFHQFVQFTFVIKIVIFHNVLHFSPQRKDSIHIEETFYFHADGSEQSGSTIAFCYYECSIWSTLIGFNQFGIKQLTVVLLCFLLTKNIAYKIAQLRGKFQVWEFRYFCFNLIGIINWTNISQEDHPTRKSFFNFKCVLHLLLKFVIMCPNCIKRLVPVDKTIPREQSLFFFINSNL